MVEFAKVFVEKHMKGDSSGHDYFHTLRVLHLAETIASQEKKNTELDMEAVQLIALLQQEKGDKLQDIIRLAQAGNMNSIFLCFVSQLFVGKSGIYM